ncbi:M23 family metallopeptidase [Stenotrophomonas sp. YIM B06876]|uniref:M23 family metallopeptidase n=1 Tax=Stenotrophomonas sp. YIM B06876 TaxID=3060211 RepID=UPI00273818FF|nr:M23 family metallopeptidase [Stenotrophomonas sp. YIM B06876]
MRPTLLTLVLAALAGGFPAALAAAPGAKWRAWGQMPPPAAPAGTRSDNTAAAMTRLRLEGRAPLYQARADNLLAGPVQVQLRPRRDSPLIATPALPLQAVLPAGASRILARLQTAAENPGDAIELVLDAVPGDPAARPQPHRYLLPFAAGRIRVDQGYGGRLSHDDEQNRYAVDFALPEGTPVLAARAGTVMQVRDGDDGQANFIRILHEDGGMAVYAHLQPGGVQVGNGQTVAAGQRIGLSGNSGRSTAPHLHFAVQANTGLRLESIPFRMLSARGELHFARDEPATGRATAP